jgi:hypothetical protein
MARWCAGRWARFRRCLREEGLAMLAAAFVLAAMALYREGAGFVGALAGAAALCSMAAVPLHYGWRLGAPRFRPGHDAHFGDEDGYRDRGMFDER